MTNDSELVHKNAEITTTTTTTSTWIGIDLGTTHCSAAVWDSNRGDAKWMRLKSAIGGNNSSSSKWGRLVPSVVTFIQQEAMPDSIPIHQERGTSTGTGTPLLLEVDEILTTTNKKIPSLRALIGQHTCLPPQQHNQQQLLSEYFSDAEIHRATVCSAKRILQDDTTVISVYPLSTNNKVPNQYVQVTPQQILAILLKAIRIEANLYIQRFRNKKHLKIPLSHNNGTTTVHCTHAVIGVPASFSHQQRKQIQEAATSLAGFQSVHLMIESTAAAMAYGLAFVGNTTKTILVFDMGGGTCDITVMKLPHNDIVLVHGNSHLGGDDLDEALVQHVQQKILPATTMLPSELRGQCRRAKEQLCGDVDHGNLPPQEKVLVTVQGKQVELTQEDFHKCSQSVLDQVRKLLQETIDRLDSANVAIDEVILVGGSTRIPAIRTILKESFPSIPELCTSINAMSAVAKGAAIQAAILSNDVPLHEIKAALMIESTPYSIGVLTEGGFIEVIPQYTRLPAEGRTAFRLARNDQGGVSVNAVELVEHDQFSKIADFTFLLRRLKVPPKERYVDIYMKLDEHGQFFASTFDTLDPEHTTHDHMHDLGYFLKDQPVTREQIFLICVLVSVLFLYVYLKLMFHEVEVQS